MFTHGAVFSVSIIDCGYVMHGASVCVCKMGVGIGCNTCGNCIMLAKSGYEE